jgi:hypothetical protein
MNNATVLLIDWSCVSTPVDVAVADCFQRPTVKPTLLLHRGRRHQPLKQLAVVIKKLHGS